MAPGRDGDVDHLVWPGDGVGDPVLDCGDTCVKGTAHAGDRDEVETAGTQAGRKGVFVCVWGAGD